MIINAPWEVTAGFLEKHKIDFVAHDDAPYADKDCQDVYEHIKSRGMFVATDRIGGKTFSSRKHCICNVYLRFKDAFCFLM